MLLTTNKVYSVPLIEGRDYTFSVSGVFAGGTVDLAFYDTGHGAGIPFPVAYDTHTGPNEPFVFTAPANRLDVELNGATGSTSIVLNCILCPV